MHGETNNNKNLKLINLNNLLLPVINNIRQYL